MPNCHRYKYEDGDHLAALQRHTPTGPAWDAYRIPGKNAYKLWSAFADIFRDMNDALCRLIGELNPYETNELLPEWETSVGLPDKCLPRGATLKERRAWVIWRLQRKRWTTADEWKELAALFGLEIRVVPGWWVQEPALYAMDYPRRYDLFPKLGRFRVYIDVMNVDFGGFDYGRAGRGPGYPIPYGANNATYSQFQCMIERIRPANVVVIWNAFPVVVRHCTSQNFDDSFSQEFC